MKKLFIGALALTMFTACSQDEIVEQQQLSSAITFDGAFVDNATRAAADPSITTTSIDAFDVWGYVNSTAGVVFDQQRVTASGEGESKTWSYSPLQYWLPGNKYYFGALAPVVDNNWTLDDSQANKNGVGVVSFKNVDGTEDLLYAATIVDTKDMPVGGDMDPVELTFSHLLSKVKFSFTNGFAAPNYTITVSNIKMTVPAEATINLAVENWWDNDDWKLKEGTTTTELNFGNMETSSLQVTQKTECQYERLTIPTAASQEYVVTFDVELFSGTVSVFKNTLSTTITGAALEMGKAYNFHATLDETNIAGDVLKPIEFTVVEVKEWVNGNGHEGGVIDTKVVGVSSQSELNSAIQAGATNFRLTENMTESLSFSAPATTLGGRATSYAAEYTLDLNDKTIENQNGDAIVASGNIKLTINGTGNVKAATKDGGASGYAVWAYDGATVIIYGGEYYVGDDASNTTGNTRNDCIYAGSTSNKTAGYIYIYGGKFSVNATEANIYNDQYWVLNLSDNTNSEIKVYGGEFVNFDPSKNKSENPAENFVAEGYEAVKNGDNYNVVPALEDITVTTAEELFVAVNKGGNITLNQKITVSSPVIVNAGKTVVLNLNGKTLTNKVDNEATDVIIVKGNLTINGNGTVEAVTGNDGYAVISEGVLTINGGTFKAGVDANGKANAVIYARGNGQVYVKGGKFPNDNNSTFVLNKKDADRATTVIECTGGHFYNFNPSSNAAEGKGTNFCHENYKAQEQGDGSWKVVLEEKAQ